MKGGLAGFTLSRNLWRELPAVLATGAGFCLTLGWVWFPELFKRLRADLPDLLTGALIGGGGVSLFFIALGGGFVLSALAPLRLPAGRLPAGSFRPGMAAHAAALACAGLSLPVRGAAPGLAALLLGLALAGTGVWWTARLLGLGPWRAGLALAVAALLSTLLAALLDGLFPPWSGLAPVTSYCWLSGGLLLSMLLSMLLSLLPGLVRPRAAAQLLPLDDGRPEASIMPGVFLAAAFFTLGLVASAQPNGPGGQAALALGIALAAFGLALAGRQALLAPLTAVAAGLAAAVAVVFCGQAAWLAALAEGAAQGAAVAALAAAWQRRALRRELVNGANRAGLVLALALLLVNGGGMTGTALGLGGRPGIWLLGAVGLVMGVAALAAALAPRNKLPENKPTENKPTLWPGLTPREDTVAGLVARGLSNPEICEKLFVSDNTVRTHLKRLYQKTGAANRAELERLLRGQPERKNA